MKIFEMVEFNSEIDPSLGNHKYVVDSIPTNSVLSWKKTKKASWISKSLITKHSTCFRYSNNSFAGAMPLEQMIEM